MFLHADPRNLAMLQMDELPENLPEDDLKVCFFGTVSTDPGKLSIKAQSLTLNSTF